MLIQQIQSTFYNMSLCDVSDIVHSINSSFSSILFSLLLTFSVIPHHFGFWISAKNPYIALTLVWNYRRGLWRQAIIKIANVYMFSVTYVCLVLLLINVNTSCKHINNWRRVSMPFKALLSSRNDRKNTSRVS